MNDRASSESERINSSARSKPPHSGVAKLAGYVGTQLLGLLFFVGFPALVTAIAPVSWVKFERRDGQVSALAQTCLLFVIPYRTETISPVTGFGDRFFAGTTSYDSKRKHRESVKSEDEAFLVIHSDDRQIEVSVTPANIKSVEERSEAFLKDPQATELKLFVVANWKFSVIAGGLISLLTVLYVAAIVFGGAYKLCLLIMRLMGVGQAR